MQYEKELILLKPGVREYKIIGKIINRFEKKGLDILGLKILMPSRTLMEKLYVEHKGKDFYDNLIMYMSKSPIIAMVVGGKNAVYVSRMLIGATDPQEALPGSIRGDYALSMPNNIVHASDSIKSAKREIKIFFTIEEIID